MNLPKIKSLIPESIKRWFRLAKYFFYAALAGFPERKLKFIGVTGSSGKSTTSSMIYHVLQENGYRVGVITTLGAKAGSKIMETGLHVTSPDPKELQKILKYMVKKDIEYVILESSSHALAQGRFGFIKFEGAVYTNIKSDHLDWHKTWHNYAIAKGRLIKNLKNDGVIVLNRGDKDTYDFLTNYSKKFNKQDNIITYTSTELTEVAETRLGLEFIYSNTVFKLPILGSYNLENALATINIASSMGIELSSISSALSTFPALEGRMQLMQSEPFMIIVNFAHNADALEKSLETVRRLISLKNRVIVVFGSAGRRDVEKRGAMGEVAAKLADITVITAEDSRDESLFKINSQILDGAIKSGGRLVQRFANTNEFKAFEITENNYFKGAVYIFDEESVQGRYDAIEFAIKMARPGDIVITEGKGHEQTLCFGTTEYPFTDQEAVRRVVE